MEKNEFIDECKKYGLNISPDQMAQFDEYAAFLKEYNEKINLTAIVEYSAVLEKHFFDSLLCSFGKELRGTLVDVGTGAGFPGVVLKIAYPELKVILVEPLQKRCIFLRQLIERLGLNEIEVVNARGEDYSSGHREEFDFVTARAVSNLNGLIEVCGAMVKVDGYFLALRGANGLTELKEAEKAWETMGFVKEEVVEADLSEGKRVIAYLHKLKVTPKKYPRKYSIIKQRPL